MNAFEVFKVGAHTSSNGKTLNFSEEMLRDSANKYDPSLHEAPIVVGHPKDNHPAFGWIKSLDFSDGKLTATPGEVNADFAEIVASGAYKKRSASWYLPDSPTNPKPGTLYLRHVGFLGAQPPAIKGLQDVTFHEHEEGVVEFADTGFVAGILATAMRKLREWLIAEKGIDAADQVISPWVISELEAESRKPIEDTNPLPAVQSFNEPEKKEMLTPEEIAALKAENEKLKSAAVDFSEKESSIAKRELMLAKREIGLEVDAMIAAGKVLPTSKDGLVEFMASLDDDSMTVEFGEGDAAKKLSPRQFMKDFINSMPKVIDFSEHSKAETEDAKASSLKEANQTIRDQVEGKKSA